MLDTHTTGSAAASEGPAPRGSSDLTGTPHRDDRRRQPLVRRRLAALLVVVCALLGAGAGLWWGLQQQATHRATSVVLVNPLEGNPFSPEGRGDELINLETEAQLARSDTMGKAVARALGEDQQDLLAAVSVKVPPNTQLLEVSATGSTAQQAALRAQAFAETYLAFRRSRTESARGDRAAELEEQIRAREAEQDELSRQLATAVPRSSRSAVLTQQIVNLSVQADELQAQLGATRAATPDPGQVVTPAVAGRSGLPGGPLATALLGLLAGAAVGWVGSGLGRQGGDGEQDTPAPDRMPDRAHAWPAPLLGTLPASAPATALATVRAALLAAERDRPLTALVCHPTEAPGSVVAVGLARSLAAARLRTVVVDVSRPLGPPGRGLADVLRGEVPLEQVLMAEGPYLRMLGAGGRPADLDDTLAGPAAADLLAELRETADVVLICTGAATGLRTQALAALADTVLLEVPAAAEGPAAAAAAVELLRRVGASTVRLLVVNGGAPASQVAPAAGPARPGAATRSRPRLRVRLSRWVSGRRTTVPEPALSVSGGSSHPPGGAG
ncbi:hypothetical protein GGQ22_15965 [Nocardioides sp. zg-579]|uniref:Polysaccharide chain length determinant N-terminal domain-containing protein n=1 Tax=Nocardioides marmotae TaxID=2663857 RepID=A0A6I3JEM6_9ACTN|nr:hypothetical protein [Nocardioides marmotae]MCR6032922.1 hypothetical protein [Gordonia jinghuaiqii]MTB96572.1 hypothetical protein [Nocardioides marmotae]QKE01910.1 hypothetical protein HPC71_13165 [Nocardioides marmotae]